MLLVRRTVEAMISAWTQPLLDAREVVAAGNLAVFVTAVTARGTRLAGEPVRAPPGDRDGRYCWDLPLLDGSSVRLPMPGVGLPRVRDDLTAAAPCLYVDGEAWWWNDAVYMVAGRER